MACHRRKWKGVVKAALLAILYQVTHKWVGLETRVGLFTLRSLVYALRLLLSSYTACCVADRWSLHPGLVTSPLLLMASSTCGEGCGTKDGDKVSVFSPLLECWDTKSTTGPSPTRLYGGASTSAGHHLYHYGGRSRDGDGQLQVRNCMLH